MLRQIFFGTLSMMFLACQEPSTGMRTGGRINAPETLAKPYVVMLSIDGFRWDYDSLYETPNLRRIRKEGTSAKAMLPSFPASTFPNHYSIATGLYPGNHGLISNTFFDTKRNQLYRIADREKVADGSWYGGTPLWVLAEQQDMLSASYFWVGTEAEIQGIRPSVYFPYDGSVSNEDRIHQVIDWLEWPEATRPHCLSLYFSMVDSKGHKFGPESSELGASVREADRLVGLLDEKLQALGLPIYLIITSDHGMYRVDNEYPVYPEQIALLNDIQFATGSTVWNLYSEDTALISKTQFRFEEKAAGRYDVYRRGNTPKHLHYGNSHLVGDLVLIARPPYIFSRWGSSNSVGQHGYDPMVPEMQTIFYLKGPDIRPGLRLDPFENVHIYPLVADILELELPEGLDGDIAVLDSVRR